MIAKVTLLAKNKLGPEAKKIPPIIEVPVKHENFGDFIIRPGYKKGDIVQVLFNERALDKLLITGEPEDPKFKRKHSFDDAVVIGGLKTEQEQDLPAEEPESLYIANLDKKVKLYINPDGTFRIANDQPDVMTQIVLNDGPADGDEDGNIIISKKSPNVDIELRVENNGNLRIVDNKNGTELKFDLANIEGQGAGTAIFTLASKLLLGSSSASEGATLGDSDKDWKDNHRHKFTNAHGVVVETQPPTTESPETSKKVFLE